MHLTGYYIPVEEDEGGFPGMMGDEDMDDEDEDEDEDSDEDGKIIHLGRPRESTRQAYPFSVFYIICSQ